MARKPTKGQEFIRSELHKYKVGTLHSGSKRGPKVKSRSQAVAIALNSARRKGYKA